MRRAIAALTAAMLLLLALSASALADAPEPAPCVPGVATTQYTDAATHNVVEVTVTTTCNLDGTVDDITYDREVLYSWFSNARGGGYYVAPDDMPVGRGGNAPGSGRAGR